MDAAKLQKFDKKVLAQAVNVARRKQLVCEGNQKWEEWLLSQDPKNKFNDPARHSTERLAAYLSTLSKQLPGPKGPDRASRAQVIKRPQKFVKRLLPWLEWKAKEEHELSAAKKPTDPQAAAVMSLVQRTRRNPRYKNKYDFPSYEKGWLRTNRLPLPDPGAELQLLGLDCEMCRSAASDKELLQVAVVDSQGRQLLKELVRPACEVLDYRTELTGITAADLEDVQTDRAAVAARIQALLVPGTVLVGHSLHYDLEALQLDHQPVIDTAMLFTYQGLANATPSLTLLAEQLLNRTLRGAAAASAAAAGQLPHDSVEDAAASMALVQREVERIAAGEGATLPLPLPEVKVDKEDQAKLCIHKLPANATAAAVRASFAAAVKTAAAEAAAAVEETGLEKDESSDNTRLLLVFKHPGQANEAFGALPGKVFTDSVGRHSKHLQLQGTNSQVVVRKMACHNGLAYGKDKAKDRGAKKGPAAGSKRKAAQGKPAKTKQSNKKKKAK